ncbi:2-hydroxyacid dehydrogenase [Oceaniglobus indicus]|uniref:2-hydroxyacid dehydrogenase n=1 Tax=Oceaniglobus indicus TaxID=2047749 RepID=UPI000C1806B3|nr:glyoxylate/hydroxypyruvate reductase A [Oceaniglobus indicus]
MPDPVIALSMPRPDRMIAWRDELQRHLPGFRVAGTDDITDPETVRYAVVWKPPTGLIAGYPNLRAVVSIGAGIDHVAADSRYPTHVPVIKTIGPNMTQRMREYIALHVLRHHREQPAVAAAQARREWDQRVIPPATRRRVGILGMGHLGRAAAQTLRALGFDVAGWSRSGAGADGVPGYAQDRLDEFLGRSEILVCLLPLTDDTRGILNAATLGKLPKEASIINAARGDHVIEDDLLAGLESGHLSHATLDVFATEPLPRDHPFWTHPKVTVTPHVASLIDPASGGRVIADNIKAFEAGQHVPDLTRIDRGY